MDQLYIIWKGIPSLLTGTLVTINLTLYFLALGFILGIILALGRVYSPPGLQLLIILPFERFFRAVPALVLLFLFYFGSSFFHINISAFMAAVLAMGLRSAAYQSEIFRGAIQSIGEEQMKAARSLGMNTLQSIRYVILPQALRLSIPSWSNEYAVVLKDSSLAYAVGVTELLRQGRYIVARTFGNALLVYTVCALIYFILVFSGNQLLRILEEKYKIPGYEIKQSRKQSVLERI
ncbi:MAG: amino acid ABC transporter permease [Atribacterota bacterium]|nr:amino acid ABC transporter permease [Atribacterota bacterium]MDD4895243.1 amino acid ABC transporter permease [Atribacterota bacterium]MDD5636995.1 amino acid ABC transporter permease [Atribacterota bacterium]